MDQDADGDSAGIDSLAPELGAASLGALLAGGNDSVELDVLLPDGEHATNAAPIAKMNRTLFSMGTSWVTNDASVRVADWGWLDRRGRGASVVRARRGQRVAGGSQSVRADNRRPTGRVVVMRA